MYVSYTFVNSALTTDHGCLEMADSILCEYSGHFTLVSWMWGGGNEDVEMDGCVKSQS